MSSTDPIDLGHGHTLTWCSWVAAQHPKHPDLPDVEHFLIIVEHQRPDGAYCHGGWAHINTPDGLRVAAALDATAERGAERNWWTVESWEPLTLTPSLLCRSCGDHGFVRGGRWVPA